MAEHIYGHGYHVAYEWNEYDKLGNYFEYWKCWCCAVLKIGGHAKNSL